MTEIQNLDLSKYQLSRLSIGESLESVEIFLSCEDGTHFYALHFQRVSIFNIKKVSDAAIDCSFIEEGSLVIRSAEEAASLTTRADYYFSGNHPTISILTITGEISVLVVAQEIKCDKVLM
jgi:hypothetical protein